MPRLTMPEAEMTPAQADVCAEVVAGKRGKIPTPMIAWLQNPELARRAQGLGEVLRFGTSLSNAQVEIAILVCAHYWEARHIWRSHSRYALEAGISEQALEALASGDTQGLDEDGRMTARVVSVLLADKRLNDALYNEAVGHFGVAGIVELVALVGYYSLVALTVNAFELGGKG